MSQDQESMPWDKEKDSNFMAEEERLESEEGEEEEVEGKLPFHLVSGIKRGLVSLWICPASSSSPLLGMLLKVRGMLFKQQQQQQSICHKALSSNVSM